MTQVSLTEVPEALGMAFAAGDPHQAAKVEERRNVERMERMFAAIAAGRFEELLDFLAPDVTFEIAAPAGVPWVRRAAGAREVASAVTANFRSVLDQRPEPLALVAQGDTVMVMARETGRWAETGEPYAIVFAHQFTFRDGLLAAFRSVAAEPGETAHPAA